VLALCPLEKRHLRFFGGFEIVFDYVTNDLSFGVTQHHGFVVVQSTAHEPTHFQCFTADLFGLPL